MGTVMNFICNHQIFANSFPVSYGATKKRAKEKTEWWFGWVGDFLLFFSGLAICLLE